MRHDVDMKLDFDVSNALLADLVALLDKVRTDAVVGAAIRGKAQTMDDAENLTRNAGLLLAEVSRICAKNGVCSKCHRRPSVSGTVRCTRCRTYNRKWQAEHSKKRRKR
jgi:hypothetical protein